MIETGQKTSVDSCLWNDGFWASGFRRLHSSFTLYSSATAPHHSQQALPQRYLPASSLPPLPHCTSIPGDLDHQRPDRNSALRFLNSTSIFPSTLNPLNHNHHQPLSPPHTHSHSPPLPPPTHTHMVLFGSTLVRTPPHPPPTPHPTPH